MRDANSRMAPSTICSFSVFFRVGLTSCHNSATLSSCGSEFVRLVLADRALHDLGTLFFTQRLEMQSSGGKSCSGAPVVAATFSAMEVCVRLPYVELEKKKQDR